MNPELPPTIFLSDQPGKYRRLLLDWFDKNKRQLPWRSRPTLYGTWVSEMMLQQTTVKVVVPYWEKFLTAFPDVKALAAADLEEVLSLWSGLGYYRRARQLHEAARIVVTRLDGELPRGVEGWLALPGIGPYASGAVASIGLGVRVPALDANARRVYSRWLIGDPKTLADLKPVHLDRVATRLVDEKRPGAWNEAVMELGALVCRAADPRCSVCPVRSLCRAHLTGKVDLVPPAKTVSRSLAVQLGLLVFQWRSRVFLLPPASSPVAVPDASPPPVRADISGLHAGLWGLPATAWLPPAKKGSAGWPGHIWRPWLAGIPNLEYSSIEGDPILLGRFRHAITKYRLVVQVYGLRLADALPLRGEILNEPAKPQSRSGEFSGASPAGTKPLQAGFLSIPSSNHPISNLVAKSLRLVSNSSV